MFFKAKCIDLPIYSSIRNNLTQLFPYSERSVLKHSEISLNLKYCEIRSYSNKFCSDCRNLNFIIDFIVSFMSKSDTL